MRQSKGALRKVWYQCLRDRAVGCSLQASMQTPESLHLVICSCEYRLNFLLSCHTCSVIPRPRVGVESFLLPLPHFNPKLRRLYVPRRSFHRRAGAAVVLTYESRLRDRFAFAAKNPLRFTRFPVLVAHPLPKRPHNLVGYEDRMGRVLVKTTHSHFQIDEFADVQGEHNAWNVKEIALPPFRRLRGRASQNH